MSTRDSFLDQLRRPRPDPGGGSASAHGALMAAALAEKIVLVEKKRARSNDAKEIYWEDLHRKLEILIKGLTALRNEDVEVYRNLSKIISTGNSAMLDKAAADASLCPFRIMQRAVIGLGLIKDAGMRCRTVMISDALVACEFMGAALAAAGHIGIANLRLIRNPEEKESMLETFIAELKHGMELLETARREIRMRHEDCGR